MKLKIKKQVEQEQEVNVELPAFFKHHGSVIMIKENGMIVKAQESFACSYGKDSYGYDREITEILSDGQTSNSGEFYGRLSTCMQHLAQEVGYDINLNLISEFKNT